MIFLSFRIKFYSISVKNYEKVFTSCLLYGIITSDRGKRKKLSYCLRTFYHFKGIAPYGRSFYGIITSDSGKRKKLSYCLRTFYHFKGIAPCGRSFYGIITSDRGKRKKLFLCLRTFFVLRRNYGYRKPFKSLLRQL